MIPAIKRRIYGGNNLIVNPLEFFLLERPFEVKKQ
jgi:hypothetical protein